MVTVRIVGLLVLALVMVTGCGASVEQNDDMNAAVRTFVADKAAQPRPFMEFTSWDWDKLYLVNLDGADADYVEEVTGEDLDVPWGGKSGVFVYFKDGKRVRAELMSQGAFCAGIYTRSAVVDPTVGCWLRDENSQKFPVK